MTYNVTVYLAGPIQHDDVPNRWREEIIGSNTQNNVEFINPLDLVPEEAVAEAEVDPEEVVRQDLQAIDESDALLVRWKEGIPKAGTPMEMIYAQGRDKTVVTWYEGQLSDLSPWVKYFSDDIVDKGSDAVGKIQRLV